MAATLHRRRVPRATCDVRGSTCGAACYVRRAVLGPTCCATCAVLCDVRRAVRRAPCCATCAVLCDVRRAVRGPTFQLLPAAHGTAHRTWHVAPHVAHSTSHVYVAAYFSIRRSP